MSCEIEISPGVWIGGHHPCFIIAEIGQNHQGDLNIAKKLIETAKDCGADCVKFQKTDLKSRFTQEALDRPYLNANSWGKTYEEHKSFLEFNEDQYLELKQFSSEKGILFAASGMDKVSVDFLHRLNIPFFKVGSGDANNFPLLIHTAKLKKPMIVSTGMQDFKTVKKVYEIVTSINDCLCILQCTSAYPVPPSDAHLNVLKTYRESFPKAVIGYSGHEAGIEISIAAVALGAKVLERHLTLCHTWKGNDHASSLEPSEFKNLISKIRTVELAFGSPCKSLRSSELLCYNKLSKSIVASRFLPAGTVLCDDMIDIKVTEPHGCGAEKYLEMLNKTLKRNIKKDESILECDIEDKT